ncbi:MAG: ATP-binding protein [Candidatus Nomurabacteria bacterium]|jgi:predicted AAA+ superfamily ATPase|nr:ATP-binding protein [Candidatus Nomurabacteria bacterium]
MINRDITSKIMELTNKYSIVSVLGPRQSGKSTLLKDTFQDYKYVTLEDIDERTMANEDPRGFLQKYDTKIIIDEAQYAPEIFSYLQTKTDQDKIDGQYILSGSQNFLLLKSISQSLAGRVGINTLLPLSYSEISKTRSTYSIYDIIYRGSYPRIYDKDINPTEYYEDYLRTYLDRDVNELLHVREIATFNKFLQLCALRVGQILNVSSLSSDCGISIETANSWLSILESSYIIFRLQPYFKQTTKRLIKSPKLYFYDTGLLCYLLNITTAKIVSVSHNYGNLFENFIISELSKKYYNQKRDPKLYFWRDSNGKEVDLIDETNYDVKIYEIKSGMTGKADFSNNVNDVGDLINVSTDDRFVIYGNNNKLSINGVSYFGWQDYLK